NAKVIFYNSKRESRGGKIIIRLKHEKISRASRQLLKDVSIYLKAEDKVCIIGANGSGKTTLLNAIYEKYKHSNLQLGYFYQQLESLALDSSILENILSTSRYDETTVRTALARLNIKADDVY